MEENYPEATNFQFVDQGDSLSNSTTVKKVFLNNVNSYHGTEIVKKIRKPDETVLDTNNFVNTEIYGTLQPGDDYAAVPGVKILNANSISFHEDILACDIIIFDISQESSQLTEARKFLKFFEAQLQSSQIDKPKRFILMSTIMTWARTMQELNDANYRERRPHPCFINHLIMEGEVISLQKKYKDRVSSVVICPGIVYGGRQDIFHNLYKKCFFNNTQLDLFAPATNAVPMIYIQDFARIMSMVIRESTVPYILAVQPESLPIKDVIEILCNAAGGPEVRIKICPPSEVLLIGDELMTQRVFNHLTLNLHIESEYLKTFDFSVTGFNLEQYANGLKEEFFKSRKLKPIKILIDGSPFAYQDELADMLATFYSIHRVQSDCFLGNFSQRLKRKIKKAEEYTMHMNEMKSEYEPTEMYEKMIEKVTSQIADWMAKLDVISDRLKSDERLQFHEVQDFVMDRLTSFACCTNQGYVMNDFELDAEMASFLFLDPTAEDPDEFNESTKPDYIIIMNRTLEEDETCMETEGNSESARTSNVDEIDMKRKLREYYNSHYEDVSLTNFFLDRDIIPIEINFDRDVTKSELCDIFESIKSKIGPPYNYGLSQEEQEEINKLKTEIAREEAAEKAEEERMKAIAARDGEEKEIENWTKKMLETKRQEIRDLEKRSLPTRHYLLKYILPNITQGLTEVAKTRPKNAVEFLAKFLLNQEGEKVDEEADLDDEIVDEFKRLVESAQSEN